ncbi:hypothetical protein ES703_19427 [subsurface metagenome]
MRVGAILPHLQNFGGVRRFLEIGNVCTQRGIDYTIFSKKDHKCAWFTYTGKIQHWSKIAADYILIGDPPSFKILPRVHGKVYICVIAGGRFLPMYQQAYGKYPFILNNRVFKKYFPKSYLVEGGVNIHRFKPKSPTPVSDKVRVLFYHTSRAIKGSRDIQHALRGIPGVTLVGLRGLSDQALAEAYHTGDFFVSWEHRAGWGNMAAEALASGLTVVTNGVNCEPFADRVIRTNDLRKFFSNPHNRKIRKSSSMADFSWEVVVDKLLKVFVNPVRYHHHH